MSSTPYILTAGALTGEFESNMVPLALLQLGVLARDLPSDSARLLHSARECAEAGGFVAAWERLLALEWLVARCTGREACADALAEFAGLPLADAPGRPTVREMADTGAAVTLVPLAANGSGAPGVAALIFSRTGASTAKDERANWEGAAPFLQQRGLRLDTVCTPHITSRVEGRSWNLGAHLAWRCMETGNRNAQLALAADWLPTGIVDSGGGITAADWGNKPQLKYRQRRWLVSSTQPSQRDVVCAPAATVEIAWNHVAEQGTVEEGKPRPWPTGVHELHSFVSAAREPVLAAALQANAPRCVLWHTSDEDISRKPATDIKVILSSLRPSMDVRLAAIVSNRMSEVERALESALGKQLQGGLLTLFNVTQGNRLMSFAAHTMARRYASLWLLYRDIDNDGRDFTAIRYDGRDHPVTFILRAPEDYAPEIRWNRLLDKPPRRQVVPWQTLFDEMWITTGNPEAKPLLNCKGN